jgi:predicted DNA-binding transcriptional regulator YafY
LFNAIVQKKALSVRYAPFNGAPFTMNFHPHFLKQYNNRWFVFGLNELLENPTWNMALDRIEEITELTTPYRPSNINWDDYFSDIIGVTRFDGALEEVQLLFDPKRAKYVQTKPLHESQKESTAEGGLLVRLQVVPNPELEQVILSFGEEVKVLKPLKLKERINDRAKKMQELYSE